MEGQPQQLVEQMLSMSEEDIEICYQEFSLEQQLELIITKRDGRNSIAQLLSCLHNQWSYERASPDEGDPDFVAQCCDLIGFLIYKRIQLSKTSNRTYETDLIDYPYDCTLKNGENFSGNARQLALKLHQETAMEAFIKQHAVFYTHINESGSLSLQEETVLDNLV